MANYCLFGASHVTRWADEIRKGIHVPLPNVYMWGQAGLANFSNSLKNNIASHHKAGRGIWLFVSDFRFGNNFFKDHADFEKTGLFIDGYSHFDRNLLSLERDKILYDAGLKVLDYYASEYKGKIKFIFYDLFVREYKNKINNKYMINGIYQHPVWNYAQLIERYKENSVDISVLSKNFDSYTVDQQGHPSAKCMAFLYNAFLTGDAGSAFISAENAYNYFQLSQFTADFNVEKKYSFYLGVFFMKQSRYDLASMEFHKLLSIEPFNDAALVQLGVCKKRLGLKKEARLAFDCAATINPKNIGALAELGRIIFEESDIGIAKNVFMQLLANQPNHPEALLYIARIYYIEKNFETALNFIQKLLAIDATHKSALELYNKITAV